MSTHLKFVRSISHFHSSGWYKNIQSLIEFHGSLDAVIILLRSVDFSLFLEQSKEKIKNSFDHKLVEPIYFLKSIYPYLKKAANCKVIFVASEILNKCQLQSATRFACHYGLRGFCISIQDDLKRKGIDIRHISIPGVAQMSEQSDVSSEPVTQLQFKNLVAKISRNIADPNCGPNNLPNDAQGGVSSEIPSYFPGAIAIN